MQMRVASSLLEEKLSPCLFETTRECSRKYPPLDGIPRANSKGHQFAASCQSRNCGHQGAANLCTLTLWREHNSIALHRPRIREATHVCHRNVPQQTYWPAETALPDGQRTALQVVTEESYGPLVKTQGV